MTFATESELQLEGELRDHFQQETFRDLDDLKRRLIALESRLGIASEAHYGPGKLLAAEGEQDERDEEALTAEDIAGVPLAYGYSPGRSLATALMAEGFDTFDRRTTSKTATEQFKDLLAEVLAGPDDELATRTGDKLQPHEYKGVPLANGF